MKNKSFLRITLITLSVIAASVLILFFREYPVFQVNIFNVSILNRTLNHQFSMFAIAMVLLVLTRLLTNRTRLSLLTVTKKDGPITPEPWLGIKPKPNESWNQLGRNFAVIITLITAIAIYFQTIRNAPLTVNIYPRLLMALLFSISNSFSEEVIYQFSFSAVVVNENLNPKIAKALSALTFGIVHYFGNPGGIPGVLLAAFLGWFLTKSILETKGFFWAWLIHFLQDVVIFSALFITAS